jgi:capsular polysaccharide transport system permease protein
LFEPIFWMATFYVLFALTEKSAPTGMTMAGFLVTGFVPYQLFRETSGRVSLAVQSNRGLLFYPQVQPLDLMVSRMILEGATIVSVFGLLVGAEALILGTFRPDNLLYVMGGFALALGLGGSLGVTLGGLSVLFPSLEKFSPMLLRPLFWLSGIFFTANEVPMQLLRVIEYNPILHCVEMVRDGWFSEYHSRHLSITYPLLWVVGLTFFGLVFERGTRTRIQLS